MGERGELGPWEELEVDIGRVNMIRIYCIYV